MVKGKTFFILASLLIISIAQTARAQDSCSEPAPTGSGLVRGTSESETATCVWRGIPYAAAPVGELRWKAPQPAPQWSGVRDTVVFGNRCMQKGLLPGSQGPRAISEDCLFLNIWRPREKSGKLPVMVWVHGGGYITGGGDEQVYWGDRLAEKGGLVVVSINYRLNIFGFMAGPALRDEDPHHSTGGYGTLDQVFALRWVRDNIANFGGDPGKVTIFGESAGGWSICTLLATPLAKGLFNRVIMESGACEASRDPDAAYEIAKKSFSALNCDFNDLACMRKMPATTVLAKGSGALLGGFDYVPVQDGYVLKATPLEMIKSGDFNRASVMAGTNLDEFAGATKLVPKYYYTLPQDYERKLGKAFETTPEQAAKLVLLYPLAEFNNRPVLAYGRMFAADAALLCPTYRAVTSLAGQNGTAYLYRFDYDDLTYSKAIGVFHCAEIPFVFNNLDRGSLKMLYPNKNLDQARALSQVIQGYWINFAKTGDPNGPGLPAWAVFQAQNQTVQVLDTQVRSEPVSFSGRCEFWETYPTAYLELMNGLVDSLPGSGLARPSGLRQERKPGKETCKSKGD